MDHEKPHIVFLSSPGIGHILPCLELAKKFVIQHNFSATFLIFPDFGPKWLAQKPFLEATRLPDGLDYLLLPSPDFNDLPADMHHDILGVYAVGRSLPSIRKVLADLSQNLNIVAFVADLFGTDTFDIAREFDIPPYMYFTSTAMCLSLFLYAPKLDQSVSGEYTQLHEPIRIPGCIPLPGKDVPVPMDDRQSIHYKGFIQTMKKYLKVEGFILNTFQELEPGALQGLQDECDNYHTGVYTVGPLVQSNSTTTQDDGKAIIISNWLDTNPPASVLYICFGSHWTLSQAQMNELAHGLEISKTRFIWVVRLPTDGDVSCMGDDPLSFLPQGFIERTKESGLLVPYWTSQQNILCHGAIGGFVTHCGWNSILESLVNGVPMIAWPLGAEQKMNAFMLTEDVRVAFRVKEMEEDGLVEGLEIANIVRNLMGGGEEGNKVRERVRELKHVTKMVLLEEGSSSNSLADLASKWKANHQ